MNDTQSVIAIGELRTIILYLKADRAFFVYGFAKNESANFGAAEEIQFRKAARYVFGLSALQMEELVAAAAFTEVEQDDEKIPQ